MYSNSELLQRAFEAAKRAYAPYSKIHVGAAVLLSDGNVIEGSNQECASYGLCQCAERVALHYAHSTYPDLTILKIAVASPDIQNITPCGACRQVMTELATANDFDVITENSVSKASELLPSAFSIR